jgi:hypothetical protein
MIPAGLVIWICEGTKRNHRQVELVNANPRVVTLFLEYLSSFGIDKSRLRARVQCSKEDVRTEVERWSGITGIPIAQFTKPILKAGNGRRKTNSVIVRYSSAELKERLFKEAHKYGFSS